MAETSNFVIQYLADISNVKKQLREVEKVNKATGANLTKNFTSATDIISRRIKSIRSKPVFDKTLGRSVIKTFAEVETVFRATDGKLKTMTQSSVLANGKLKTLNTTLRDGATGARGFGEQMTTLAKRALVTIPVWLVLRTSILGVFRSIRDGLKDIADFDRALQKLKRNISATSTNIEVDFGKAQAQIEQFSLKSGKSVQEITNAIQKFATVGFDLETSLKGGLDATKLAVTLFGDASETANAFARSLRVLTEGTGSSADQQKAISEALALTDQLWKTNAFEVNEFSNNLEKFAGTAKIANLSINETIALLATLSTGGLGNRAGRLLRSTILRSLADIENVTKTLGLKFDPKSQPTIVFIQELVTALKSLSTTKNVPVELAGTLAELFTVRSTEVLGALTALEKTLKSNLSLKPDVANFNKEFEDQNKEVNRLVERHQNLNKEMKRAFVTGIFGAGNYKKALEALVGTQQELIGETEKFGQIIRDAILVGGVASIIGFRKQLIGTLALLKSPIALGAIAGFTILNFKAEAEKLANDAIKENQKFHQIGKGISDEINKGFKGQLSLEELDNLIDKIETIGLSNVGFDLGEGTLVTLKKIREEEAKISKEKSIQNDLIKKQEIGNAKRLKIAEIVLQNELELLKSQGFRTSQIIEGEQLLRKQLGIEKEALDQLSDQLKKEREINEERRLRSELGSESIKLFKIAQTEGTDVAKRIGDVLAGNTDFSNFVRRGGEELDIFKEKFADIFQQQQALAFFRGDVVPGAGGLRGGAGVAIQEEGIRTPISTISAIASIQQRELVNALQNLSIQEQTVQAGVVNIATAGNIETLQTLFRAGEPIIGPSARLLVGKTVRESRRIIDLNLNLDGRNFDFQGTPEALRTFAKQITTDPNVLLALENQIVNALENPQSKISKGIDQKIDQF